MTKLLKYFKKYIKECMFSPLFKLCEVVLELCVPLLVSSIIDDGIVPGSSRTVVKYGVFIALCGLAGLAFSLTAQYFAAKAATGFVKDIRHDLFAHVQRLDPKYSDKAGTSSLLNVMTADMQQLQTGANLFLRLLLRSPFVIAGAAFMAFRIDRSLSLIFAAVIIILAAVIVTVMVLSVKTHGKVKSCSDTMLRTARENLSGVRVIRAFTREESETEKFREQNASVRKLQVKENSISSFLNPVTFLIINTALFVLLYFCGKKIQSGPLTTGGAVALSNYLSQILVELIKLANLIVNVSKSITCGNRIQTVFEIPEEKDTVSGECITSFDVSAPAVEFRNVTLNYTDTAEPSLSDVCFTIPGGCRAAIIGPSGSGKTSIVNLINGFYAPTEGKVLINGRDVNSIPKELLRKKVSTVSQKAAVFKGTVRDNMRWGKEDATDEEIICALKAAEAYGFVSEKGGLDFELSQYGRNLSGGQKQRLSVARALVCRPEILVLDDSFSALDFATEASIIANLKKYENMTVITVTQRISSLKGADLIIVTDDGKSAGTGTAEELSENCPEFREIFASQAQEGGTA